MSLNRKRSCVRIGEFLIRPIWFPDIHHSEGRGGGSYTVTPGQYREDLVLHLPQGDYKSEWIDSITYFSPLAENHQPSSSP
jgi:hypothetical protein